ncbi:DNA-3-methyladenine glycosylase [Luteolibacter yonseiensis]|uniref:Putative 3-methyladenine DNA glycosylase n=1 Tax=Luteolibacter yonseiensis TaxID=1144680 RepID=A0A934R2G0_9BACT|nr:DNA-3-methyladenine glycosylase [Luteolibacter yonseiensis]MBK1814290.1 DNA-3-methyladenine glycosylase [Luteolibacter yonseiensis]
MFSIEWSTRSANGDVMERLTSSFFERNPVICARELIGARFHWNGCVGKIVETEAYLSVDDPACHTWFRPSARSFVESHAAGAAYVYLNYGMHWLFNVLVKGDDGSGFVLFRALEPLEGLEPMRERRPGFADHLLAAGPGKLTKAFGIDGSAHGGDFLNDRDCGIYRGERVETCCGERIGITRAVEFPWRFGDPSSASLSRKFTVPNTASPLT